MPATDDARGVCGANIRANVSPAHTAAQQANNQSNQPDNDAVFDRHELAKLQGMQLGIQATLRQQFIMCAHLRNTPAIQDHNFIGMTNGG